jgi:D-alanyl-D-alanine carboxypeptidase
MSEKRMTGWYGAFAVVSILLIAITPGRTLADRPSNRDGSSLAEILQGRLEQFRTAGGYPGGVVAVALPDGTAISASAGMADPEAETPMKTTDRFMSGSIGKSFVAAVALALSRDGRLDLDAPVSTWLGGEPWFERLPNGPEITTRFLLQHGSGLVDHNGTFRFVLKSGWKLFFTDPHVSYEPEELVEFVLDREPLFPPGAGYHYTDTGYVLVGLIIEEVSGRSYYEELEHRFLEPLSLDLTSPATARRLAGLAVGHSSEGGPMGALASLFIPDRTVVDGELVFDPKTEWTGGGLVTNPRDLAVWAKRLYEGRVLRDDYLSELLAPGYVPMPKSVDDPAAYGLGVSIAMTRLGPVYGHGGYFPGFNSTMGYFPEHALAAAVQWSTDGIPGELLREQLLSIAEAMLGEADSP